MLHLPAIVHFKVDHRGYGPMSKRQTGISDRPSCAHDLLRGTSPALVVRQQAVGATIIARSSPAMQRPESPWMVTVWWILSPLHHRPVTCRTIPQTTSSCAACNRARPPDGRTHALHSDTPPSALALSSPAARDTTRSIAASVLRRRDRPPESASAFLHSLQNESDPTFDTPPDRHTQTLQRTESSTHQYRSARSNSESRPTQLPLPRPQIAQSASRPTSPCIRRSCVHAVRCFWDQSETASSWRRLPPLCPYSPRCRSP